MPRLMTGILTATLGLLLGLGAVQDAEAKRLGGGKSFGSRPAYSLPYQRATPPASPARAADAAPAAAQNAVQRQALANRGGLMGMLGGLALGGILGALLFGGAFEGINPFDIVVLIALAGLAYFLFAAWRRRAAAPAPAPAAYAMPSGASLPEASGSTMTREAADPGVQGSGWASSPGAAADAPVDLPAGFDAARFLEGARRAYQTLQAAWDRGDLSEIRALTSDDVFAEIQAQLRARQGENRTEVLHLEARILEARQAGPELEASVLFDAFLREVDAGAGAGERGHQVKEVWHFVKPAGASAPTWFLDGIQQLE